MDRYKKNRELINEEEQVVLSGKTVAVVGLGGLGGHIAEQLARLGVGNLILIDSDVADYTNLNRQLLATERTVGTQKANAAYERFFEVNSDLNYTVHAERLTLENGLELLAGADIVVDAVDNVRTRYTLESVCEQLGVPLVHGAIGGWWGQVSVIFPGDKCFSKLYPNPDAVGAEAHWGNPAFTPAIVASLQVAETLKLCLGKKEILRGKLLRIDILNHEYFTINI